MHVFGKQSPASSGIEAFKNMLRRRDYTHFQQHMEYERAVLCPARSSEWYLVAATVERRLRARRLRFGVISVARIHTGEKEKREKLGCVPCYNLACDQFTISHWRSMGGKGEKCHRSMDSVAKRALYAKSVIGNIAADFA
jgi:hypothetical protein